MGILEKIAEIEREISRTQKNKGKWKQALGYLLAMNIIEELGDLCVWVCVRMPTCARACVKKLRVCVWTRARRS